MLVLSGFIERTCSTVHLFLTSRKAGLFIDEGERMTFTAKLSHSN